MKVGGTSLHMVEEGKGASVLLLHGFPDSSHLWRHQIPALTDAGLSRPTCGASADRTSPRRSRTTPFRSSSAT
jgi:pimeloyl-ACP methyl ester carboxylesterase